MKRATPYGRYDVLREGSPSPPPPVLSPMTDTVERDHDCDDGPPTLSLMTSPVSIDTIAPFLQLVSPVRPAFQSNSPRSRSSREQSRSPERLGVASPARAHTPRERVRTPRSKRRDTRLQCRNNCNPRQFFANESSRNRHERETCKRDNQVYSVNSQI